MQNFLNALQIILYIFEDNELDKKSVTEKCSLTANDEKNIRTMRFFYEEYADG